MGNTISAATDNCGCPLPEKPMSCAYSPCGEEGSYTRYGGKSNACGPEPYTGPGSFEDLHKDCKDVFPSAFDGAKLIINKGLTSHMHISHTMQMTTAPPLGSYKFGCTYVGDKKYSPTEIYPVLTGEIDPSGNMNAQIVHKFNALTCKFVSQIQNTQWSAVQLSGEIKRGDSTIGMTLGNIDLMNRSGIVVGQYLQRITSRFAAGAEFLYQYGCNIPGREIGIYTLASKYVADDWIFCGCVTPMAGGINLSYYQKASEGVQIGVEMQGGMRTREMCCAIGYQVDLPKSGLLFKGQLDSNWSVAGVLEKKLAPMPFTLGISGYAHHAKKIYRFGIGFTVGD